MNIEQEKLKFLEHLMARIILAGGRRFEPMELREMGVSQLMDMIYSNGIQLSSNTVRQVEYDLDYILREF